jgi:hypothetical protein
MWKNVFVITAVIVLTVSGLALASKMGMGGGCCSTHQTHQ